MLDAMRDALDIAAGEQNCLDRDIRTRLVATRDAHAHVLDHDVALRGGRAGN